MATSESGAETPGPLRLLWNEHEQSAPGSVSLRSDPDMAKMAKPTVSAELHPMGSVPRVPQAPSAAPGQDRAQRAEIVANLKFQGAGCRSPARPDLGEARAGHFSGLPDPKSPYVL